MREHKQREFRFSKLRNIEWLCNIKRCEQYEYMV
ncbi:MAG TPA: hypothetical protein DCS23_01435 [Candidatus Yonathbacteria bacterium]|nr:hypothetical protein [Candidatus Yonathbacteria bacterium]